MPLWRLQELYIFILNVLCLRVAISVPVKCELVRFFSFGVLSMRFTKLDYEPRRKPQFWSARF